MVQMILFGFYLFCMSCLLTIAVVGVVKTLYEGFGWLNSRLTKARRK